MASLTTFRLAAMRVGAARTSSLLWNSGTASPFLRLPRTYVSRAHPQVQPASFGAAKLLENAGAVLNEIYAVKPESYGKGKKGQKNVGKAAKYMLKASVSSTQGPSVPLDPRTIDPNSPFFLTAVETLPSSQDTEPPMQQAA